MSPRIIFFGTPACAVPVLESLAKNFQVIGVVTASDRPVGRKKILTPSPVKVAASGLGIPIVPFAEFADLTPDLCIVAAYNKIIPASMLSLPRHGFINIHPSLLPAYRGPSPVKSAILDGCASTGVTIIALDQEMDHGPILAQASWSIPETADTDFCEAELFALGTRLLIDTIPGYITGALAPVQQDHSQATYTKKFTRDDGRLDWSQSAIRINDRIRALAANPGTWTTWGGKVLNIIYARAILNSPAQHPAGTVIILDGGQLAVACGTGLLALETVQLDGAKRQNTRDFLNGHPSFIGSMLI